MALLHCELRYGAGWVYAPGRWGTADGCVPIRVVWAYFAAVAMGRAVDVMDTARGIGLALAGGHDRERLVSGILDDAFPSGPPASSAAPSPSAASE